MARKARKSRSRSLGAFAGPGEDLVREAQHLAERGRCPEAQTALFQAAKVGASALHLDYGSERVATMCAAHGPGSADLGLDVQQAIAKAKQAAGATVQTARTATAYAAPKIKSAYAATKPHAQNLWNRTPRNVKIGVGLAAVAGLAWYLIENRDRNPPGTHQQFAAKLWKALQGFDLSDGTKRLIIAQFALESGWGVARAAVKGFNYGNITTGSNWDGPATLAKDRSCFFGGHMCIPILQWFRKYYSDEEAIKDYLSFLGQSKRYAASYAALKSGDLTKFATQLREDGYYTAAVEDYTAGMKGALAVVDGAKGVAVV